MDRRFIALVATSLVGIAVYGSVAYVKGPRRLAEGVDNARRLWWKGQFDIVFVGDSRTHNGVSPEAVGTVLVGQRMGNFGWSGLGWGTSVFKAAQATLDPNGGKVLVLGVSPHGLTQRSAGQNAFLDTSQSTWLDRAAVKTLPQATNFFASYGPNQWLRSLNPELGSVPYVIHEDGWFEAKTAPLEGSRIVKMHADRLRASPFDPKLLDLLCSEVRRMRAEGYRIITYRPPVSDEMREIETSVGHYDESVVRAALESAGATYVVIPGTYQTYDGSHLASNEAKRFSTELGKTLSQTLGAP